MSKAHFWHEWKEITRLINSTQLAFNTEIQRWQILNDDEKKNKIILIPKIKQRKYKLSVQEHVTLLSNEYLFSAMVLQYSCGAIEEHGRNITRELVATGKLQVSKLRVSSFRQSPLPVDEHITAYIQDNAIERWGNDLLVARGLAWTKVIGGQPGITEIMSIRNAIAHGTNKVNSEMINRFNRYGGQPPWKLGESINLNLSILQEYRARLKSFARYIND